MGSAVREMCWGGCHREGRERNLLWLISYVNSEWRIGECEQNREWKISSRNVLVKDSSSWSVLWCLKFYHLFPVAKA